MIQSIFTSDQQNIRLSKKNFHRREFLRISTLAASSLYFWPSKLFSNDLRNLVRKGDPKSVIIIGAGLAGLTAAYELNRAGHRVNVLEAQTHAGGRVRTLREPLADGLYAELGAGRIPDIHEWTLKYVKEFGLSLTPFYPNELDFTTFIHDTVIRSRPGELPDLEQFPVKLTPEEEDMGLSVLFNRAFTDVLHQINNVSEWPTNELKRIDQMTIGEFIVSKGLSPEVCEIFGISGFGNHSALEALCIVRSGHGPVMMSKISGGNDQLPKAFASRIPDKIRYGTPVVRIEQDQKGVHAVYMQQGRRRRISGDKMICAIPFTVLRHLEIAPRFSLHKHRAVQEMGYASLSRITFQVRKRYWNEQGQSGFANTDIPAEIWHPTFDQPGPRGLLQLYLLGPSSEYISSMSEAERVRYGIDQTERVFPGIRDEIEGVYSYCWDNDPWARGAVRLMYPGQVDLHQYAASSEGNIHFAGEHTSLWFAWMNGAIESGLRAAQEVNDA